MNIHLNLLSKQARTRVHYSRWSRLLLSVLALTLITEVCVVVILRAGDSLLQKETDRLELQAQENDLRLKQLKKEQSSRGIRLETEFNAIQQSQTSMILWSEILASMSAEQHEGIRLNQLKLNDDNKGFAISGLAKNREALIQYRDALLENDVIETIEAPLSNFTQRENISFEFVGIFKPITL